MTPRLLDWRPALRRRLEPTVLHFSNLVDRRRTLRCVDQDRFCGATYDPAARSAIVLGPAKAGHYVHKEGHLKVAPTYSVRLKPDTTTVALSPAEAGHYGSRAIAPSDDPRGPPACGFEFERLSRWAASVSREPRIENREHEPRTPTTELRMFLGSQDQRRRDRLAHVTRAVLCCVESKPSTVDGSPARPTLRSSSSDEDGVARS